MRRINFSLLSGIGLGAWAMYLLDAERGRRRRALARDKLVRLANETGEALETGARDLAHRSRGVVAQTRSRFGAEQVADEVLVERVRSRMGRFVSHPKSIDVTASGGRVTLSGPILADELDDLVQAVSAVRGVSGVENRLEVHQEPGDVPGLQGGRTRPGARPELAQRNWAPAIRLLATIGGGTLALGGLRRGGVLGGGAGVAGAGVVARALSNIPFRRLVGAGGRRAVDFHKTITVAAPVEQVFDFWTNFENLPLFMSHLREVRRTSDGRSHWVAQGPGGVAFEWDAEVTRLEPNRLLAWRSVPGSTVGNAGVIRFEPTDEGGTRLDIRMSYNPPAGALGHVVASLFGADPKSAMDEDLVRLQSLFVQGKTTAAGEEVTFQSLQGRTSEGRTAEGSGDGRTEPAESSRAAGGEGSERGQGQYEGGLYGGAPGTPDAGSREERG